MRGRGRGRGRGGGRLVPFAHHYEAGGLLARAGGAGRGVVARGGATSGGLIEVGGGLDFGAVVGGATVGAHIDAFEEYNLLVGESDGGAALSERDFAALKAKAAAIARSGRRLFVSWRHLPSGADCVLVGPHARCFCGHSYKAHAWYNTDTKRVHCRCPGCECAGFEYVVGHGAWWICKHVNS